MESDTCSEKLRSKVNLFHETLEYEKISVIEAKNADLLEVVDGKTVQGQITPDRYRENGEALFNCIYPLTWVSSPPKVISSDSTDTAADFNLSPRTPKEDIFDPFVPRPDELILAPRCNNFLDETQDNVVRWLNFSYSTEFIDDGIQDNDLEVHLHEKIFLECVYESVLDAFVSKQAEGVLGETLPKGLDSDDCSTPTSFTLLNGVADTCPRAPKKSIGKSRIIDPCICRKLEF